MDLTTVIQAKTIAALGAILAMLGVALGAFGSHGLRGRLPAPDLAIYETAVRYQLFHALGLLAVAWVADRWPGAGASMAGLLMLVGILIFSGSLYILVLTGPRWMGAVTPLGGISLIAAWALLAFHLFRVGAGP